MIGIEKWASDILCAKCCLIIACGKEKNFSDLTFMTEVSVTGAASFTRHVSDPLPGEFGSTSAAQDSDLVTIEGEMIVELNWTAIEVA